MSMVFCRGCGKELHETAPTCPHCGFVQLMQKKHPKDSLWMSITAGVLATLCLINWLNLPDWDKDLSNGLWIFSILTLVFGTLSIQQKRRGKIASIISIVIVSITMLILIGR